MFKNPRKWAIFTEKFMVRPNLSYSGLAEASVRFGSAEPVKARVGRTLQKRTQKTWECYVRMWPVFTGLVKI